MAQSRLTYAVQAGALELPETGDITLFRPRADQDLSALPAERLEIIQGYFPDYQAFENRGLRVAVSPSAPAAAAIVFLPRAKVQARALIAEAVTITNGGPVVVDGQKTDGIESILRDCRKAGARIGTVTAKAHGKIFTLWGGDIADWASPGPQKNTDGFVTAAGVFSADGIDLGSLALAQALPAKLSGRVADLGAGWGYLSGQVLLHSNVTECHLIEAEHDALLCARANIDDPRAQFHWADALSFDQQDGFDHIVCNPPFHTSRAADPDLGREFIATAARLCARRGTLTLVANRHLPYEQNLLAAFHDVTELSGNGSFKIFRATKPQQDKRKRA